MNMELTILLVAFLMSMILSSVISITSYILSEKLPNKEKVSVYECGFDPIDNPGKPFSVSFFLMAILFLMFDLEMSYLFPWSNSTFMINKTGQILVSSFVIMLIMGLIYEWVKGGLEWE